MITDLEYPLRPAFSLLTKILDEHTPLLASLPNQSAAPSFGSASANAFGGNPSQAAAGGLPPAQKGKLEGTLANYLTKYQDPKQADTIMKVQKELDETKVVLVCPCASRRWSAVKILTSSKQHKTIESVLERGEKLDNLVERSNALSAQSKMFYKTAKKVCHLFLSLSLSAFPLSLSRFIAKLLLCSDVARRTYGIFIMFPVVRVLVVWSFDFSCTTRYPPTPPHTHVYAAKVPRDL